MTFAEKQRKNILLLYRLISTVFSYFLMPGWLPAYVLCLYNVIVAVYQVLCVCLYVFFAASCVINK